MGSALSNQTRKIMRITRKKKVAPALWVMECPKCGKYCASASEKAFLPEFITCNCDDHD